MEQPPNTYGASIGLSLRWDKSSAGRSVAHYDGEPIEYECIHNSRDSVLLLHVYYQSDTWILDVRDARKEYKHVVFHKVVCHVDMFPISGDGQLTIERVLDMAATSFAYWCMKSI